MDQHTARRHGAVELPDGSIRWRVWAPKAETVDLMLVDGERRQMFPMLKQEHGFFLHALPGVREGQRYAYRLNGGPERPDPASLWQPDDVHTASAVLLPGGFTWTDARWKGIAREDLVFYELHVGTFTPAGTFEAIIPRLDSLRELGVTALQLMPVAQFPGTRNWGYDGVFPYAAQNSYGGPHGLHRLVDACHAAGLAVFLDVVYNHVGPEGNYLAEFGPYFNDHYKTGWGPAFNYDAAGCEPVRDFVLDNVRMWLNDYHFDGLRLDAVHAIYDLGARHILRAIRRAADEVEQRIGRPVHIVAESDLNDPRLLLPPERGGYGLDAQWNDDFHHAVHTFLTGERQGYYEDYGSAEQLARVFEQPYLFAGDYSPHRNRKHGAPAEGLAGDRFIVAIQNHDQIGNRARGDRLGALLRSPAKSRLAASLLLLSPHLPMLFMGEEYGEEHPFLFFCSFSDAPLVQAVREGRKKEFTAFTWQGEVPDPQAEASFAASRLTWSWPEGTVPAGLRRLYQDLLTARRTWPALKDFEKRKAWLLPDERTASVIELVRGHDAASLRAYFNLTAEPQSFPPTEGARCLFASESGRYGGVRKGDEKITDLRPFECVVLVV